MGKAGFYLYGTRGKVGNVVAKRGPKGGTVLAERKFSIKNPRTNKQMAGRVICATVAQAAKFLSPIIDHSFQQVAIGARSKDYFRKVNMNRLRELAANDFATAATGEDSTCFITTKGVQALIPNSYIVSRGSLAPSGLRVNFNEGNFEITRPDQNIVPLETTGVRHITVGQLLKAIFGITSVGEQLTFVGIQRTGEGYHYAYQGEATTPGWMIPFTDLTARRLFVNLDYDLNTQIAITDAQGQAVAGLQDDIYAAIKAAFSNIRTDRVLLNAIIEAFQEEAELDWVVAENTLHINDIYFNYSGFNYDTPSLIGYLYAFGIIRSRLQEDGSWLYSPCTLSLAPPTNVESTNFGLEWNIAIEAWMSGGSEVASDELFLQAGTPQNVIGEDFT